MNKIALRINVCADDWAAEVVIIVSNVKAITTKVRGFIYFER